MAQRLNTMRAAVGLAMLALLSLLATAAAENTAVRAGPAFHEQPLAYIRVLQCIDGNNCPQQQAEANLVAQAATAQKNGTHLRFLT